LHRHDQFNNIYLAPDRTNFEQVKHKAVEELKQRRKNGETNLIIRNGNVIPRQPHPSKGQHSSTNAGDTQHSS